MSITISTDNIKKWLKYIGRTIVIIFALIGIGFIYLYRSNSDKRKELNEKVKAYKEELDSMKKDISLKEKTVEEAEKSLQTLLIEQEKKIEEIDKKYDSKKVEVEVAEVSELDIEAFLKEAGLEKEEGESDD